MLPLIALGVMAGMQALQGMSQAEAIRSNAKLKRMYGEFNAQFAEIDAWKARRAGESDVAKYQTVIDSTLGGQRTALAAQNVDLNYGTAGEVQGETKLVGILNTLDIQKQAREKAMGYEREARNLRLNGDMGIIQGNTDASAAEYAGVANGASTFLSGYTKISGPGKTTSIVDQKSERGNSWITPISPLDHSRKPQSYSSEFRSGNLAADSQDWG